MDKNIYIREVGLREGAQAYQHVIPTEKKLELLLSLSKTGVPEIEVTAFVRSDRVPQMADAEALVAAIPSRVGKPLFTALYLNEKGFQRAEESKKLSNKGWLYTSASDLFFRENNNSTQSAFLASIPNWMTLFKSSQKSLHGIMISCAFGYSDNEASTVGSVLSHLEDILAALEKENAPKEICLADTVGRADPKTVKAFVKSVSDKFGIAVSLHLHDTRGLGIANAYAGLEAGVRIFEASVGGVGGCPFAKGAAGNIATEELVILCHELGYSTGIDIEKYREAVGIARGIFREFVFGKLVRG